MNKMIVNSSKIEKMCSFYVSDFHLEMILVPYISEKIENKEDIKIITEKNLQDTIEVLISKMNLEEDKKQKILNLGWNKENEDIKEKSNVIVIGTEDYIKQKNEEIKDMNISNLNIIDCYNFDEIKGEMNDIISQYDKSLNTLGFNKF